MAIKDILVYASAGRTAPVCLDIASALAGTHQAHLTALHVIAPPFIPVDFTGGGISAQVVQSLIDMQWAMAETAKTQVAAAERRAGQSIEFRPVEGDITSTALLHSRYADLIVVGQGDYEKAENPAEVDDLAEALVMGAGRPTLVVPHHGRFSRVGERILVAWKRTAAASRAVHDALPILASAKSVTVMEVNPAVERVPHIAGLDIAAHLARHGVQVEVSSTAAPEIDVGDAILSRAADLGVDMIVMGAYGHSRLREFVFGGVTRDLLRHMTVPVFMSH